MIMERLEDKNRLDETLTEAIGSEEKEPDFEKWKQQHPEAVEMLTSRAPLETSPSGEVEDTRSSFLTGRAGKGPSTSTRPLSIRRIIMKSPITKIAAAAVIVGAVMLSIHLWDKSTPSAYAFEQTVEAMQGKRSFHIQTYFQNRRKDEFWAEYDENGKVIRYRQEEGKGRYGPYVTLWENDIRTTYHPDGIKMISRIGNTEPELEEFDPETAAKEIYDHVAAGRAIMEIQKPSPYAGLITINVTRKDKPLRQVLLVDPDTKLVTRIDNYWGANGEREFHKGIELLEYNQIIDANMFNPEFPEDTITIDQVSQEVGLAQADMSNEEAACETVRQALEAWAAADYAKAGKLFGGAPPELLLTERYSSLQPISIISIGRPVPVQNIKPVFRIKCTYEVEHDGQVKTVSPTFTVIAVDGQPGRWYVGWWIMHTDLEVDAQDSIVKGTIVPGEKVGDYTLGMSKDDVLKSLGKPHSISYGSEEYSLQNLPRKYYMSFGGGISFLIVDGLVKEIGVQKPFYKFTNGLGVGDSEQSIIRAFGDDFQLRDSGWKDFLIYKDEGLVFEIHKENRTVIEINVSRSG